MSRTFDTEIQSKLKKYKLLNKTVFSIDLKSCMTTPVKDPISRSITADGPIQVFVDDDLDLEFSVQDDGIHISKRKPVLRNHSTFPSINVSTETRMLNHDEFDDYYKNSPVSRFDQAIGRFRSNSPAFNEDSDPEEIRSTDTLPRYEHVNFEPICERKPSIRNKPESTLQRSPTPYPIGSNYPPVSHRGRKLSRADDIKRRQ